MCGRRTVMLRSGIAVILALSSLPGQCDVNGVVTATFENYVFHDSSGYTGTWLGRVPVTDPLSGITLSCPGGSLGVFPYNSSDPTAPSLYHGFNAVLSEGSTFLGWTYDFSIRGLLPTKASSLGIDILYDYERIDNTYGPTGFVTLSGFDANGNLVASISTLPLNQEAQQTHLGFAFASPISSFTVVANNLFTDYDNISYSPVPEPQAAMFLILGAALIALPRRTGRAKRNHCDTTASS